MNSFRRTNYSGYRVLNQGELLRELASQGIVPLFERIVAEHVTYQYPDKEPAPTPALVVVVGHVVGDGVEALVVEVNGTSVRPAGGTFHLTLSLAPGHKPVESNDAIKAAEASGTVRRLQEIALAVEAF